MGQPVAGALGAIIPYDGVTRTEPAMTPPMLVVTDDPADPFMTGILRLVE